MSNQFIYNLYKIDYQQIANTNSNYTVNHAEYLSLPQYILCKSFQDCLNQIPQNLKGWNIKNIKEVCSCIKFDNYKLFADKLDEKINDDKMNNDGY